MSDASISFGNSLNSQQPNSVEVVSPSGVTSFLPKLRLVQGDNITLAVNPLNQSITVSSTGSSAIATLNGLNTSAQLFANDTNVTLTSASYTHTLGWRGTLAPSRGGTGLSSFAAGDLLYASSGSVLSRLTVGTSSQVLIGGSTPTWGSVNLASMVTGVLPVARGGTGTSSGSIAGTEALTFSAGGAYNSITLQPAGTGTVNVSNARIINLAEPAASTDATTKQYVDSLAAGLHLKEAVTVTTTGPITLSGTQTIDGVAVTAGQRVLVKNQETASQNGIYVVDAGSWLRATDADEDIEVTSGMFSFVELGSTYAATSWVLTTPDPIILGSSALTFAQFSGAGTYSVTSPLTLAGSVFGISTPLAAQYGGTGTSSYASGDILYASGASTLSRLAISTDGKVLSLASGAPAWTDPATLKSRFMVSVTNLSPVVGTTYRVIRLPYGDNGTTSLTFTFRRAEFHVETAPSGTSATVDILKNGTSILSSTISIAAGNTDATAVTSFATATAASGDVIALTATAVSSSDLWEVGLQMTAA